MIEQWIRDLILERDKVIDERRKILGQMGGVNLDKRDAARRLSANGVRLLEINTKLGI
jgi:hypothetical protein